MRIISCVALVPALLAAAGCAQREQQVTGSPESEMRATADMRVFILAGQSNMVGLGDSALLPPELKSEQERVLIFEDGGWRPLAPRRRWFGPEVSFGHEIASAHPAETVGLIKFAVSGTSLLAWAPKWSEEDARKTQNAGAGPLYKKLMEQIEAARQHKSIEIVGMLWMQGERDARFPEVAPDYEANLRTFIARIRQDLGVPRMPFILARVNPPADRWLGVETVRTAQEKVAREDPDVVLISTDDLGKEPDGVHYNADGLVELGRRYARTYLAHCASQR